MKIRSSTSEVLLVFTKLPAESTSVLTITLPAVPGQSVLTLDDSSAVVIENTLTTKLVPEKYVYFFACRSHYLQRGDVQTGMRGQTESSQRPERKQLRRDDTASSAGQSTVFKIEAFISPQPGAEPSSSPISTSSLDSNISTLKAALAKYCLIHDARFQELVDALRVDRVSLEENVELR